jgi:hypothetical protein
MQLHGSNDLDVSQIGIIADSILIDLISPLSGGEISRAVRSTPTLLSLQTFALRMLRRAEWCSARVRYESEGYFDTAGDFQVQVSVTDTDYVTASRSLST